MKKRSLGIRVSTILTAILCIVAAFATWLYVSAGL